MRLAAILLLATCAGFCTAFCPKPGWSEFEGTCYFVTNFTIPWASLTDVCQLEDPEATAVSIHNALDNTFVAQLLLSNSSTYIKAWLGLGRHLNGSRQYSYEDYDCTDSCEDLPSDSEFEEFIFEWQDGTDVDYLYWDTGEPSSSNRSNCALANFNNVTGQWGLIGCEEDYPALCQVPSNNPCPDADWKIHEGLCYWFSGSTTSVAGDELEDSCETLAHGSSVPAASHSKEMDEFLVGLAQPNATKIWFGLFRSQNDTHEWEFYDNTPLNYQGWDAAPADGYDCGMLQDLGWSVQWTGGICSNHAPFFCQLDPEYQLEWLV